MKSPSKTTQKSVGKKEEEEEEEKQKKKEEFERKKYGVRSMPIRKDDEVTVLKGNNSISLMPLYGFSRQL